MERISMATKNFNVTYSLSVSPDDIQETTPGLAQINTTFSIQAQRAGANWNVNGINCSFTFEKVPQNGKDPWMITETDADSFMGLEGVMKFVGIIFAIVGVCFAALLIIVTIVVLVVIWRRKRSPPVDPLIQDM